MYQPKTRTEDRLSFEKDRRQSEDSVFWDPQHCLYQLGPVPPTLYPHFLTLKDGFYIYICTYTRCSHDWSPKPLRPPAEFDRDEIVIHIVSKPLGYVRAYDIISPMYMYYTFSKISVVFAIWGVSKDTVFALKRHCLRSVFGPSQKTGCLRFLSSVDSYVLAFHFN